jgi:hypothetical protein
MRTFPQDSEKIGGEAEDEMGKTVVDREVQAMIVR